jgi:hypothetical protein
LARYRVPPNLQQRIEQEHSAIPYAVHNRGRMEHFRVSDTILRECIFPFVGEYQFRFVGAVSRDVRRVYVDAFPNQTTTKPPPTEP